MLGLGLSLTSFGTRGGISDAPDSGSGAARLLGSEPDGLAIDFTDQSMVVKDTTTPANAYNSKGSVVGGALAGPGGKLIYTSPSPKLCRQQNGLYAYQAHNLCGYSNTPSDVYFTKTNVTVSGNTLTASTGGGVHRIGKNLGVTAELTVDVYVAAGTHQFIQLYDGASTGNYANFDIGSGSLGTKGANTSASSIVDIGGGVYKCSATWGGGGTANGNTFIGFVGSTTSAWSDVFTATGTETFHLHKIHVRRAKSVPDYIATTSASPVYALPYEWDASGNPLGILAEQARTNICLQSNDLTNAAWTKTNATAAKTATGPDGIANSASTLTATAANGTCLQAITSASAARITSCFIKRRTGSGAIEMTQDNGSTWTAVTVTAEWTRVNIPAATLAAPTIGFRIVTSGDAIDVALVQHEVGEFVTSPIETFGSSVTRAGDLLSFSGITISQQAATLFGEGASAGGSAMLLELSAATRSNALTSIYYESFGTSLRTLTSGASFAIQAVFYNAVTGGTRNKIASRAADNDFHCAVNGYLNGTPDTAGNFAASTLTTFGIGSNASGEQLNGHLRRIMYLPRAMSNAELQAVTA